MKKVNSDTLGIMNKWMKGELTTMEADKELAQLKVHDIVMIYEDPITEQKPEGKAILLHRETIPGDGLERWKVCFEGEDGAVYSRTIKVS